MDDAATVTKQNGIKRPTTGSITGNLWDIADKISADLKRPAPRKAVVDEYMKLAGTNQATANTQYARWVVYHGAADALREFRKQDQAAKVAQSAEAKAAKQAEKDAANVAKQAERDAKKAAKAAEKEAAATARAEAKAKADAEKAAAAPVADAAPAELSKEDKKAAKEAERAAKLAAAQAKSVNPPA